LDGFAQDQHGAAAVEFTLVVPLLAMMVVLTVDLSMGIFSKMQVEDAAQAGAQYAIIRGFDSASISGAVTSATNNTGISATPAPTQFCGCPGVSGIAVTACSSICSTGNAPGTYATVSAQGTYSTLMNYSIVPSSYTFNAQSTVRLK
jgi:Flp pilus assembly protein TadG